MTRRSLTPLPLLGALAMAGCGPRTAALSHPAPPSAVVQAGRDRGTTGVAGTATPAASSSPGGGAAAATAAPPHSGQPGGGSGSGTAAPAGFTASLASGCLSPGGRQVLVAQTQQGYTVAFNSAYSDGKRGDSYGGYGVFAADSQGRVSAAWTVSTSAPLGTVTVAVGTADGGPAATRQLTFAVRQHC